MDTINRWRAERRAEAEAASTRKKVIEFINHYNLQHAIVSCFENPFDVRVPVQAIEQRIALMRASMPENEPLIVLLGEAHEISLHPLMQQALFERRIAARNKKDPLIGIGAERPYNIATYIPNLKDKIGATHKRGYRPTHVNDRFGELSLIADHNTPKSEAPLTSILLTDFCMSHVGKNIATHYHDLPRKKEEKSREIHPLDKRDARVMTILRKHFPQGVPTGEIMMDQRTGMNLRNDATAESIYKRAKRLGGPVYFYIAGNAHIFGGYKANISDNFPYEESLDAYLTGLGAHVLPVYVASRHMNLGALGEKGLKVMSERGLCIAGLNDEGFDLTTLAEEYRHVQKVIANSPGALNIPERRFQASMMMAADWQRRMGNPEPRV